MHSAMFTIHRRAAIFRAEYSAPLFRVFQEVWPLQQAIYEAVAIHGVGVGDVRLDRSSGEPAITCNVLSLSMVLSVRLSHLEVFIMQPSGDDRLRPALVASLLDRLRPIIPEFGMFSLSLDQHGELEGVTTADYIARYVKAPALGPVTGSSAAWFFGPSGPRLLSSLNLEPSSVVGGGLFVKTSWVWRADGVELEALIDDARTALRETMTALGLVRGQD